MVRQTPRRKAARGSLKARRAPRRRNRAVSAVAASTAVGTLETRIPAAVQAGMEIWS